MHAALLGRPLPLRASDINLLIGALGGNSVVPAFYDVRYGVTATSIVSSWADARGSSGFAPAITATGSKRPSWDGTNLLISFDGVDDCLACAVNALFDISGACSAFLIGTFPTNASTAYPLGVADAAANTRLMAIRTTSGNTIQGQTGVGTPDSGVATSATRRLVIVSKNASISNAIDVPNATRVSVANIAQGAGNNAFAVGNYFTGAAAPAATTVRAAGFITGQVTVAQIATLKAWAFSIHNAVAA